MLLLLVPLAATSAAFTGPGYDPQPLRGSVSLWASALQPDAVLIDPAPDEELPAIEEVRWTVDKMSTWGALSNRWGVGERVLAELNPEFAAIETLLVGTPILVYRRDPAAPGHSVGAPNSGRLKGGVPMPEGSHWKLREYRMKSFGSPYMVEALTSAFEAYGEAYPDGPAIRLGDLSGPRGGKLSPHVSHRTGRDIDIGFILHEEQRKDRYWERAKSSTFDAEKNWFLIRALVDTGRVQTIFMGARLQRSVLAVARRELPPEQVEVYMRAMHHWRGHMDHMHVRFNCEPGNRRCRSQSVPR